MNAVNASVQTDTITQGNLRAVYLLMAAFFFSLLPFVATFAKHHPDERHYTDAAIGMVHSGDYLSPKTAQGELRLKKPIVTYWLVAAGYRLAGISPTTSRLPFLIIGTLVIGLTYCFATRVFNNRASGFVAACVVALQPSLLISSIRSIPDVVLTASILVSAIGFVRLYTRPRHDWYSVLFAYMGLAIAVESKGIPAIVFGFIAFAVLFFCRLQSCKRHLLRHAIGAAACVGISSSWFLYMLYLNPEQLFLQFFGDQLGSERLDNSVLQVSVDLAVVVLLLAACNFPWVPALIEITRSKLDLKSLKPLASITALRTWVLLHPSEVLILAWTMVYLVLASCVDRINIRYQCPIAPFVATLIGGGLIALPQLRLEMWLNRLTRIAAPVLAVCTCLVTTLCYSLSAHRAELGLMLGILVACLVLIARNIKATFRWQPAMVMSTLLMLGSVPVTFVGFDTLADSKFESRILSALQQSVPKGAALAVMTIPAHSSRLRVHSAGTANVAYRGNSTAQLRSHRGEISFDVMLISGPDSKKFSLSEYDLTYVHNGYLKLKPDQILKNLVSGRLPDYLKQRQDYVVLAVRKPEILAARRAAAASSIRTATSPSDTSKY